MDQVDSPEIVDDFELGQDEVVDIKDKEVNKQKLRRRIDQYKVRFCNFFFLLKIYLTYVMRTQEEFFASNSFKFLHPFHFGGYACSVLFLTIVY